MRPTFLQRREGVKYSEITSGCGYRCNRFDIHDHTGTGVLVSVVLGMLNESGLKEQ